jgi:dTDP-4-dehydrorhamnose 3,5-epimerase
VSAVPGNLEFTDADGGGPRLVRSLVFDDDRGCFAETWRDDAPFARALGVRFVQDNLSVSHAGVLRGLHWQDPPHAQGKLVLCLRGRIFDVVVDLREGSPGFGRACDYTLEVFRPPEPGAAGPRNAELLWVPPGFAHGFLALEPDTVVAYKVTAPWNRESERTLRYDDARLGIRWPLALPGLALNVSGKDRKGMSWPEYASRPSFRREGIA